MHVCFNFFGSNVAYFLVFLVVVDTQWEVFAHAAEADKSLDDAHHGADKTQVRFFVVVGKFAFFAMLAVFLEGEYDQAGPGDVSGLADDFGNVILGVRKQTSMRVKCVSDGFVFPEWFVGSVAA